jgi:hypothetical protein
VAFRAVLHIGCVNHTGVVEVVFRLGRLAFPCTVSGAAVRHAQGRNLARAGPMCRRLRRHAPLSRCFLLASTSAGLLKAPLLGFSKTAPPSS